MIGTTVQATLWEVHFRHLSAESERPAPEPRARSMPSNPIVAQLLAGAAAARAEAEATPYKYGRAFVLTADPTGSNLLDVTRRAVLGPGAPDHDFSLIQVQRVADVVKGSALLDGGAS